MRKVVITSAVRTPIGDYGKSLAQVSARRLGAIVIEEALKRSNISPELVNEVIFGCVLQAGLGQNIARQCAMDAGIPNYVSAMTLNKVCGSGLRTVSLAAQIIKAGDADIVVTGGTESMSQAPYLLKNQRWGARMGDVHTTDEMVEAGLTDAFNHYHMGITAENLAEQYNISRIDQDLFAYHSQCKAKEAIESGVFDEEIVPVSYFDHGKEIVFARDEHYCKNPNLDKMSSLRPAFKPLGTVTAANSSGINDGAAALVVMSYEKAMELGCPILAEITDYGSCGVDPSIMGVGPIPTIKKSLQKTGLTLDDIELFELNEAFAAQSLAVFKGLIDEGVGVIPSERLNVNGGAIALGHPIGASGARILVTLLYEMKRREAKTGLACLCIGGGMGTSVLVSRK